MTAADSIVASALQRFAEKIPNVEVPCPCQFFRWLAMAGGDPYIVYHAIDRAGGKSRAEARAGREMEEEEIASFMLRIIRVQLPKKGRTNRSGTVTV